MATKFVRSQRRFSVGPIGVARQSRAADITAEAIVNGANQFSGIMFDRAASLAEKRGIESAQQVSQEDLYKVGPDGKRDPKAHLDGTSVFSLGGRLQREAYSKIIEKRFGDSIDTDLREQSGRIAAMVDGAPNSTEQYEQLFSNYVKEVAGQVPDRYLGLATDTGSFILANTKTQLFAAQETRRRAAIKAEAAKRIAEANQHAQMLGRLSASNTPIHAANGKGLINDVSVEASLSVAAAAESEDVAGTASKAVTASAFATRSAQIFYLSGQLEGLIGKQDESAEGALQLALIKEILINPNSNNIPLLNEANNADLMAIMSHVGEIVPSEREKVLGEIMPELRARAGVIESVIRQNEKRTDDRVKALRLYTLGDLQELTDQVQNNDIGFYIAGGSIDDAINHLISSKTKLDKLAGAVEDPESGIGFDQANQFRKLYQEQLNQARVALEQKLLATLTLTGTPELDDSAIENMRSLLIAPNDETYRQLGLKDNSLLKAKEIFSLGSGLNISAILENRQSVVDAQKAAIKTAQDSFIKLNGDSLENQLINAVGTRLLDGEHEAGAVQVIENSRLLKTNIVDSLAKQGITPETHPDYFAKLNTAQGIASLITQMGVLTQGNREFTEQEMVDVKSALQTGKVTGELSGRFAREGGPEILIDLITRARELPKDKVSTAITAFEFQATEFAREQKAIRDELGVKASAVFEQVEILGHHLITNANPDDLERIRNELINLVRSPEYASFKSNSTLPKSIVMTGSDFAEYEQRKKVIERILGKSVYNLPEKEAKEFIKAINYEVAMRRMIDLSHKVDSKASMESISSVIISGQLSDLDGPNAVAVAAELQAIFNLSKNGSTEEGRNSLEEKWREFALAEIAVKDNQKEALEALRLRNSFLDPSVPLYGDRNEAQSKYELFLVEMNNGYQLPVDAFTDINKYLLAEPDSEEARVGQIIGTIIANKHKIVPKALTQHLKRLAATLPSNEANIDGAVVLWRNLSSFSSVRGEKRAPELGLDPSEIAMLDTLVKFRDQYGTPAIEAARIAEVDQLRTEGTGIANELHRYAGIEDGNFETWLSQRLKEVSISLFQPTGDNQVFADDLRDYAYGILAAERRLGRDYNETDFEESMKTFYNNSYSISNVGFDPTFPMNPATRNSPEDAFGFDLQAVNVFVAEKILGSNRQNSNIVDPSNIIPLMPVKASQDTFVADVTSLAGGSSATYNKLSDISYDEDYVQTVDHRDFHSGKRDGVRLDLAAAPKSSKENPVFWVYQTAKNGEPELVMINGKPLSIDMGNPETMKYIQTYNDNRKKIQMKEDLNQEYIDGYGELDTAIETATFLEQQQETTVRQVVPTDWQNAPKTDQLVNLTIKSLRQGNGYLNSSSEEVLAILPSSDHTNTARDSWLSAAEGVVRDRMRGMATTFEDKITTAAMNGTLNLGSSEFQADLANAYYITDKEEFVARVEEHIDARAETKAAIQRMVDTQLLNDDREQVLKATAEAHGLELSPAEKAEILNIKVTAQAEELELVTQLAATEDSVELPLDEANMPFKSLDPIVRSGLKAVVKAKRGQMYLKWKLGMYKRMPPARIPAMEKYATENDLANYDLQELYALSQER